MPKMKTLRVVDPSFLDNGLVRDSLEQQLPVSAEAAFRCLEDGDAWGEWIDGIEAVEWTTPRPFGVGTTRTVDVGRLGSIDEEFIAWEDGRRMSFYFVRSSLPVFKAFAEDYVLEPRGDDACTLTWRWAFEGGSIFRGVVNWSFKRQGRASLLALESYLRANRDKYSA